jgi:phosphatidylserine/phosphatidylglycerophosphate/cardiolipin synthase-like enzyme
MGLIKDAGSKVQSVATKAVEVKAKVEKKVEHVAKTTAKTATRLGRDRFSGPRKLVSSLLHKNSGPPGAAEGIGSHARLPANASPLMKKVYEDTASVIGRGNIPAGLYVTTHNSAASTVLLSGDNIFKEHANLIRGAKSEIALQTYEWESNTPASKEVTGALKDLEKTKKAEGGKPVEVKIIVNETSIGIGPLQKKQMAYEEVKKDIEALHLDPKLVHVEIAKHSHHGLGANHAKSLIVDGEKAIICGANVQKQAGFDTGYKVEGDVAMALRADIVDAWKDDKGKDDTDFKTLKLPSARGAAPKGEVPMMVLTRPADGHVFGEIFRKSDHDIENPADLAFLSVMENAKHDIHIMSPNLNDNDAKAAILDAAKRGVKVEIVIPRHFNDKTEDKPGQGGTNEQNVKELLAAMPANKRKNLEIKYFNGIAEGTGHAQESAHTKYLTADGQISIVGSSNHDTQSWNHSRETNLLVDSREVTAQWESQVFGPSFKRGHPVH